MKHAWNVRISIEPPMSVAREWFDGRPPYLVNVTTDAYLYGGFRTQAEFAVRVEAHTALGAQAAALDKLREAHGHTLADYDGSMAIEMERVNPDQWWRE